MCSGDSWNRIKRVRETETVSSTGCCKAKEPSFLVTLRGFRNFMEFLGSTSKDHLCCTGAFEVCALGAVSEHILYVVRASWHLHWFALDSALLPPTLIGSNLHIFIEVSRFILLLKQRNDMKHLRGVLSRICWQNKPGLKRNSNLFNNKTGRETVWEGKRQLIGPNPF